MSKLLLLIAALGLLLSSCAPVHRFMVAPHATIATGSAPTSVSVAGK